MAHDDYNKCSLWAIYCTCVHAFIAIQSAYSTVDEPFYYLFLLSFGGALVLTYIPQLLYLFFFTATSERDAVGRGIEAFWLSMLASLWSMCSTWVFVIMQDEPTDQMLQFFLATLLFPAAACVITCAFVIMRRTPGDNLHQPSEKAEVLTPDQASVTMRSNTAKYCFSVFHTTIFAAGITLIPISVFMTTMKGAQIAQDIYDNTMIWVPLIAMVWSLIPSILIISIAHIVASTNTIPTAHIAALWDPFIVACIVCVILDFILMQCAGALWIGEDKFWSWVVAGTAQSTVLIMFFWGIILWMMHLNEFRVCKTLKTPILHQPQPEMEKEEE